jgi:hypothetical protein
MTQPIQICEFEREILEAMAGRRPALPWGAAVGAALEYLSGHRLVRQRLGVYEITEAGMALLGYAVLDADVNG